MKQTSPPFVTMIGVAPIAADCCHVDQLVRAVAMIVDRFLCNMLHRKRSTIMATALTNWSTWQQSAAMGATPIIVTNGGDVCFKARSRRLI